MERRELATMASSIVAGTTAILAWSWGVWLVVDRPSGAEHWYGYFLVAGGSTSLALCVLNVHNRRKAQRLRTQSFVQEVENFANAPQSPQGVEIQYVPDEPFEAAEPVYIGPQGVMHVWGIVLDSGRLTDHLRIRATTVPAFTSITFIAPKA